MRVPAAAATALASFALLSSAWHLGAAPAVLAAPVPVGVVLPSAAPAPVATEPVTTDPPAGAVPTPPAPSPMPPAPSPTPPPAPVTADGAVVPTRFGDVQVQVVVQDGRLVDVVALHLTDVDGTSRRISADAAPVLRQEALDAQSAQVDTVSSATYTSDAYRQSLQSALDAAASAS